MPQKIWFVVFSLLLVLISLFSVKVSAALPDDISAITGDYIDGAAAPDNETAAPPAQLTWKRDVITEASEPEASASETPEPEQSEPKLEPDQFQDYGPALDGDLRYTTEEDIALAERDKAAWANGTLSLGYSGIPLGYSGALDDLGPPETELGVLQEIRDLLNLFYALIIMGISFLIMRFILRMGTFNISRYFGF